jgi:hypothetical protein
VREGKKGKPLKNIPPNALARDKIIFSPTKFGKLRNNFKNSNLLIGYSNFFCFLGVPILFQELNNFWPRGKVRVRK